MTQHAGDQPVATPVETVAQRVKELRRSRGYSAAELAERMREVGVEWDRNIVANLETGRRRSVDVAELLALAVVLDVAPVHLLVPTETDETYQVTPTLAVEAGQARAWIRGFAELPGTDPRGFYSAVPRHELAGAEVNNTTPAGRQRLRFEKALHYWLQRTVGPGGLRRPLRDGPIEWLYREPEEEPEVETDG